MEPGVFMQCELLTIAESIRISSRNGKTALAHYRIMQDLVGKASKFSYATARHKATEKGSTHETPKMHCADDSLSHGWTPEEPMKECDQ